MIQKLRSLYSKTIYVEFGSEVFKAFIPASDFTYEIPSVISVSKDYETIQEVGERASKKKGKGRNSLVIKPVRKGSISDYAASELFVKYVMEELLKHTGFFTRVLGPDVVLGIHSLSTEVELSAIVDAFQSAGASTVKMVNEGIAAHYDSKLESSSESLICKIGAEVTDLFIISDHEIVSDSSFYFGTNIIIGAIKSSIKNKYGIDPSEKDIRKILANIDIKSRRNTKVNFHGKSNTTGQPVEEEISSIEIVEVILSQADKVIEVIKDMLKKADSETLSSIVESGISMSGGASNINGLFHYIANGVKINMRENDNVFASVFGLHWINSNPDLFESYEVNDLIFL